MKKYRTTKQTLKFRKEVPPPLEVVETLDETERGNNGFGSSGR